MEWLVKLEDISTNPWAHVMRGPDFEVNLPKKTWGAGGTTKEDIEACI